MIISIAIIFCIASVQCDPSAYSSQSSLQEPRRVLGCKAEDTGLFVRSWNDVVRCGIYTTLIDGIEKQVYCQVGVSGEVFTVIQLRDDFGEPADLFFKGWKEYKRGFGDLTKSFWIGLDALHNLTGTPKEMHIIMEDFEGNKATVIVHNFKVANEKKGYELSMSGVTPYDLGKSFWIHRGSKFSTKDKDQDGNSAVNCAKIYKGAWWYNSCHMANLNGMYWRGHHNSNGDGVNFFTFKGFHYSLKRVEMKIKMM